MRILLLFIFTITFSPLYAQQVSGTIILDDIENTYISKVFVTNINTQKTTLASLYGDFTIPANKGDIIRFTSDKTNRKDIVTTEELIKRKNNIIPLRLKFIEIKKVVIKRFKPSGNLKKDSKKLTRKDKNKALKKIIGLPEPKNNPSTSTPLSLTNGGLGLDVQSIYNIFSGELKKSKRRNRYELMQKRIKTIRQRVKNSYFTKQRIPENMINNFLEFIYLSENNHLTPLNVKQLTDKYLPIYLERLKNSSLQNGKSTNSILFDN